jgi:precorrin-2 dehydrogenase/sirohydrochlorin ferrochelatase
VAYAYPLLLDVTNKLAVIIGGGRVAARKARGLLDAGCQKIRVVSVQFCAELPEGVERIAKRFEPADIAEADLVFAATDVPEVNQEIIVEAQRRKIWACRADFAEEASGDFSNPAALRAGALTISVAAAGSPALAASVRDQLMSKLDPAWSAMAELMLKVRPLMRDSAGIDANSRREINRALATPDAMRILTNDGGPGLWRWLSEKHPVVRSIGPLETVVAGSSPK